MEPRKTAGIAEPPVQRQPADIKRMKSSSSFKLFLAFALLGAFFGTAGALIIGLSRDLPQIENLENFKPMLSSVVRDNQGRSIAEFGIEKRQRTSLSRIPPYLQQAIVSVEDQMFYHHFGVNPAGILRAAYENLVAGHVVQGGSTITQQLARNLFLTRQRNLSRKLRETILALQIERKYTKEQILELYLNQIYLGHGAYGVQEASQLYFNKNVEELTLAECALLASLPKAPNKYSPKNNPSDALARRNLVLELMYRQGDITRQQCISAKLEPLILNTPTVKKTTLAPYFAEYVRQSIIDRYGYDMLYKGGLQIYTTLDLDIQAAAEKALQEGLKRIDAEQQPKPAQPRSEENVPADLRAVSEEEEMPKEMMTNVVQGALVAIDPHSGEIRAMIGGRDFEKSEFNRAVQSRRQPGSGFKPFIWATALENGMTPSDRVNDAPIVFHYDDKIWEPQNYENRFYGPTTLREALEHSRNIVSIKLLKMIGIGPVIKLAHNMGIRSPLHPNLTLALGSSGVSPLEITSAYSTFATNGIYREPTCILRIVGADGETIEERQVREKIVLSEQNAYVMTAMLKGVITRGTAQGAVDLGRPAAGKTGTTNDCSDAWFIGYTPQLVAGVWVGWDDMRTLGKRQTGGRVAAPIWNDFMKEALAKQPIEDFPVPRGIEFVNIEPSSGLLPPPGSTDYITQAFKEGTAPTRQYDPAEVERMTDDIMHIFPTDLPF